MQIKIKALKMLNFKKVKDFSIEFGDVTNISGDNYIGKSSIYDAICWVLFGKSSTGKSEGREFRVRPFDADGADIDHIDVSAELFLEIDGKEAILKKTQRQKWQKIRGSVETHHTGDENIYSWNGAEIKQNVFQSRIDEIISADTFKKLSSVTEFMNMDQKKKREFLLLTCLGKKEEDIVSEVDGFDYIKSEIEAGKTIEEIQATLRNSLKIMNEEKDRIDSSITERSRDLVDIDVSDFELQRNAILEKIADVEAKEADSNKQLAELDQITSGIMKLKFEISDFEKMASEKVIAERKVQQNKLDALIETVSNSQAELKVKYMELEQKQSRFSTLSVEIKEEQKKYADLKSTSYVDDYEQRIYDLDSKISAVVAESLNESTLSCPTCGRLYEKSQIENMKKDFEKSKISRIETLEYQKSVLISENNKLKKHRLDEIIANGNRISQEKKSTETEIENLRVYISQIDSLVQSKSLELKAESELLNKLPCKADLSENQAFDALQRRLAVQEHALEKLNNGQSFRQILANSKKELQAELSEVEKKIASADNSKTEERISELKQAFKDKVQEIAYAEKKQLECEEFQQAKDAYITENVNKMFENIRFQLFRNQKNGGKERVCDAYLKNGSYYGDNVSSGAEKIIIGLEFIRGLQKILGMSTFVVIDNAESINEYNIPKMESQLIEIRVSKDKEMKVEVA